MKKYQRPAKLNKTHSSLSPLPFPPSPSPPILYHLINHPLPILFPTTSNEFYLNFHLPIHTIHNLTLSLRSSLQQSPQTLSSLLLLPPQLQALRNKMRGRD